MPSIAEFIANFGLKELVITLIVIAVIVIAREEKRIFRRSKNDTQNGRT